MFSSNLCTDLCQSQFRLGLDRPFWIRWAKKSETKTRRLGMVESHGGRWWSPTTEMLKNAQKKWWKCWKIVGNGEKACFFIEKLSEKIEFSKQIFRKKDQNWLNKWFFKQNLKLAIGWLTPWWKNWKMVEMLENRVSFLEKMIEKKVFFKQILNKIDRCNSF